MRLLLSRKARHSSPWIAWLVKMANCCTILLAAQITPRRLGILRRLACASARSPEPAGEFGAWCARRRWCGSTSFGPALVFGRSCQRAQEYIAVPVGVGIGERVRQRMDARVRDFTLERRWIIRLDYSPAASITFVIGGDACGTTFTILSTMPCF